MIAIIDHLTYQSESKIKNKKRILIPSQLS